MTALCTQIGCHAHGEVVFNSWKSGVGDARVSKVTATLSQPTSLVRTGVHAGRPNTVSTCTPPNDGILLQGI